MNPAEASSATAGRVAPVSRDGDGGPVFEAPWQANAFAVTLALHQRGVFTWTELASTLAAEIKHATAAGDTSRITSRSAQSSVLVKCSGVSLAWWRESPGRMTVASR